MARKPPRRTAQRIQEVALALFNRFGEPNVATAQVAADLGISPGNLQYHYPNREALVRALLDQHTQALAQLLPASAEVRDVEDAWFFLHSLFEQIWAHRFLYRNLNDLLGRDRQLEQQIQALLAALTQAAHALLAGLQGQGQMHLSPPEQQATADALVLVLGYWLSLAYVRNPRQALEPESGQRAMLQGAIQALSLLGPHLAADARQHLQALQAAYTQASTDFANTPP